MFAEKLTEKKRRISGAFFVFLQRKSYKLKYNYFLILIKINIDFKKMKEYNKKTEKGEKE